MAGLRIPGGSRIPHRHDGRLDVGRPQSVFQTMVAGRTKLLLSRIYVCGEASWPLPDTLAAHRTHEWVAARRPGQPSPNVFVGGNHWTITFYDDRSPAHTQWVTQDICFFPFAAVGTHISGMWYSTTFPDWNGRYSAEGDQVKMHGDFGTNVGHDGMTWEITTARTGAGEWKEWIETPGVGITIGWGNATWNRVGVCPSPPLGTVGNAAAEHASPEPTKRTRTVMLFASCCQPLSYQPHHCRDPRRHHTIG